MTGATEPWMLAQRDQPTPPSSAPATRVAQLEGLAEVALVTNSTLALDHVLRLISDKAREIIGAHAAAINLTVDDDWNQAISCVSLSDKYASWRADDEKPDGSGIYRLVCATNRPVRLSQTELEAHPAWRGFGKAAAEHPPLRGWLAAPLVADGRNLGLIQLTDKIGGEFTEADEAFLVRCAHMASVAIWNARLRAETERRRHEAEVLAEVVSAINASLDLDTVLQRVTEAAKDLCRSDLAEIALCEPEARVLRFRYRTGVTTPAFRTTRIEPGKGAAGLVLATGRPFRTADYAADSRLTKDYLADITAEGVTAFLVAPIPQDGSVIGVVSVGNRSSRAFTDADETVLGRLAEHAGVAIHNARLFQASERRRLSADTLAEVGRAVSRSLDPTEIAQQIADSMLRLFRVQAATVYRRDPASGDLRSVACAGDVGLAIDEEIVIPEGTAVAGLAAKTRHPAATTDFLSDPRLVLTEEQRTRAHRVRYRAVLSVPMMARHAVVGAIAVGDVKGRAFDADEIRMLSAFAGQAALALENARLFDETRARLAETEALLGISRVLAEHLPAQEAMRRVCRALARAFGADMAGAYGLDPTVDGLVPLAGYHVPVHLLQVLRETPFSLTRFAFLREALETGKTVWIRDYPNDPRGDAELLAAWRPRSLVFSPARLDAGAVGGLFLAWWGTPRRFTIGDTRLVEAATALVAQALERARSERELQVRLRQQATIAELGQRALESHDAQALMDEAVRLVARGLDVEYCQVLELLPDGTMLRLRAGVGWKEGYVGHATVGAGLASQAGYTLLSGPVIVEDLRAEQRFAGPAHLHEHGVVAGLSVVIGASDRPFGTLGAHTTRPRRFTENDVGFLQAVANVLATAVERSRVEGALRVSEERLRGAFEDSRVGRALQAPDGRYLQVNRALCDFVGYQAPELLTMRWQELTHPEDFAAQIDLDAQLLAGKINPYLVEKRYLHKQGHVVWASLSVSLLREAAGSPRYLLAEIDDITPRKQAEAAQREYVERLRILREIDQQIIAAQLPETIARTALGRLRQLVPCERASVTLFDLDASEATVLATDGTAVPSLTPGTRFPLDSDRDVERLLAGEGLLAEDLRSIAPATPLIDALRVAGLRSSLRIPLRSRGVLIGALNLTAGVPSAFHPEQVEVARDVADSLAVAIQNAGLLREAVAGRERLRELSHRLVDTQEQERRHVARELHDEIGQILTGLKLTLERNAQAMPAAARTRLDEAAALVGDLMTRVRDLSLDLRPAMLDDLGLLPALLWHTNRYASQTGVQVTLEHAGAERRLEPAIETAAYRIAQEALTNIARHAGVREARLRVQVDDAVLSLEIEDRGRGFDPARTRPSSGLTGMRERAVLLGGAVRVESAPGAGTRVTAELPLTPSPRADADSG